MLPSAVCDVCCVNKAQIDNDVSQCKSVTNMPVSEF